jgi:Ca2+-binding EF-hand superfamily protein
LNDDGTIDKREFVQMLTQLGAPVSDAEAEAAMEVRCADMDDGQDD